MGPSYGWTCQGEPGLSRQTGLQVHRPHQGCNMSEPRRHQAGGERSVGMRSGSQRLDVGPREARQVKGRGAVRSGSGIPALPADHFFREALLWF